MQWTGHPYLLCEEVTDAVRQVLPLARNKDLSLFFDYEGLQPVVREESRTVRALVERLLTASIAATRVGSVDCRVDTRACGPAECRMRISVADTSADGPMWPHHPDPSLVDRLVHSGPQATASLLAVRRLCEAMGGHFDYRHSDSEGGLATAELTVPCFAPLAEEVEVRAPGALAWLIGHRPRSVELLERRLQRRGFTTRIWPDTAQAEAALSAPGAQVPELVIGSEWDGVTLGDMIWLRQGLPARGSRQPMLFLAVDAASETARATASQGVYVQVLPFSPRQLAHATELARLGLSGSVGGSDTA